MHQENLFWKWVASTSLSIPENSLSKWYYVTSKYFNIIYVLIKDEAYEAFWLDFDLSYFKLHLVELSQAVHWHQ